MPGRENEKAIIHQKPNLCIGSTPHKKEVMVYLSECGEK